MDAVLALPPAAGITAAACTALGLSRASVQRRRVRLTRPPAEPAPRPRPPRAPTAEERQPRLAPRGGGRRTAVRARPAARAALRRPGAGGGLRHPARRGRLSLLDPHP